MSSETYIPNPAAFPTDSTHGYTPGMELRDYFAAKALAATIQQWAFCSPDGRRQCAQSCYEMADAMLVERAKTKTPCAPTVIPSEVMEPVNLSAHP